MHILRGIRMMMVRLITRATCHCEMRATCFPEGGVPTIPTARLLATTICLRILDFHQCQLSNTSIRHKWAFSMGFQ